MNLLFFIPITFCLSTAAFAASPLFCAGNPTDSLQTQSEVVPWLPYPVIHAHQIIRLHRGWNLVSLGLYRGDLSDWMTYDEAIPKTDKWFFNRQGRLYSGYHADYFYPLYQMEDKRMWDLDWCYYVYLDKGYVWKLEGILPWRLDWTEFQPSNAWDADNKPRDRRDKQVLWQFWGYPLLQSVPFTGWLPADGRQANPPLSLFNFIWKDSADIGMLCRDVKIIKMDNGRIFIPYPDNPQNRINEIRVMKPGEGYLLGFLDTLGVEYHFDGWDSVKAKSNLPVPNSYRPKIKPPIHFLFPSYTHWSYPVIIDTVDLAETPLQIGDELAAFDGSLCVGASIYQGEFPLKIACWKDDIATPSLLDGYIPNNEMTFKWFDVSENSEAEFVLPPITQSVEDDPIAPSHSGFGAGFYALRHFTDGVMNVLEFPKDFRLGQNYPNPFNSQTVIPLELPQRSKVKVELFNLCGQRVGYVYEGIESAGWPKLRYYAANLASGVYFYHITAEGLERGGKYNAVGKMVLLK